MKYSSTVIGLVLLLLGLAGCVDHVSMVPQTTDILQVAVQVSRGEATLADLEQAYQESGITSSVDPDALAVAQILDGRGNGNGYLDGAELIAGIQHYASGQPVDGRAVDGRILIGLIQLYAARTPLGAPAGSRAPRILDLDISPNPALTSDHDRGILNLFDLIIYFSDPQGDVVQASIHAEWPGGFINDFDEPVTVQDNIDGIHRSINYYAESVGMMVFTVILVDSEGNHSAPVTESFQVVSPEAPPPPGSVDTAFLALINQYRSQSGQCWDLFSQSWVTWPAGAVRNLALSSELTDASIYHSQYMADHDCFAHQCPGEPDLRTRIEQFGYTGWTSYGENIAAGMETPEAAFDAWRNSPGHNQNMLTCQFEEIGVGRVYAAGSQYGWYWTTDFGSR